MTRSMRIKLMAMGIEQHLMALPRVGNKPEGTTGAELQMGHLQFVEGVVSENGK